jgi:hypothetical protein
VVSTAHPLLKGESNLSGDSPRNVDIAMDFDSGYMSSTRAQTNSRASHFVELAKDEVGFGILRMSEKT